MFFDEFKSWQRDLAQYSFEQFSKNDIEKALSHERLEIIDFLALLSPTAMPYLEQMAQKAHRLTMRNFGKSILLFTPLYLANFCSNQCVYCSYNIKNKIVRRKLSFAEVEVEAKAIAEMGLQHLLLLTGESRKESSPEYIADCARILRPYFASLGIEVYPLEIHEYRELYEAGIDTLTIFQEAYDEDIYASVHLAGPKRVHRYRLEAPERACEAGLSGVTIGALLGLGEWRKEAFFTGLHASYLQKTYPEVEVAISIPRMRPHAGSYKPQYPITDAELVQILLAYRLFMPRVGITLSTRESAAMRDALLPLGITKLSAGSLTSVGGYSETTEKGSAQFEISDERSVEEITTMLRTKGYQPVFCDWVNLRDGRGA
jgi:2-iminoacetate synthase